jgi:23S rRNA (adenine2503-C2)-methyltransferase
MNPPPARQYLLGLTLDELRHWCAERDLPAFRAAQILEWVYTHGVASFDTMTNLPKDLRAELPRHFDIYQSEIAACQESTDSTIKLLLRWPDAATSECVLIPERDRRTACISSQVGCPVGCTFCASGLGGLVRQLTAGQIVEQALRIRARGGPDDRLHRVVFMGLGEPLANYDNVLAAIRILHAEWGLHVGARKITLSTVGLPKQIRRLAREQLPINLAISLHATTDELRRRLIPWAERVPVAELLDAARDYFDRTHREITLEYVMLAGTNMRPADADRLARICRTLRANVNLIAYNPVAELGYDRPTPGDLREFVRALRAKGVNAHVRQSRGLDIDAACGQLRRKQAESATPSTEA